MTFIFHLLRHPAEIFWQAFHPAKSSLYLPYGKQTGHIRVNPRLYPRESAFYDQFASRKIPIFISQTP